MNQHICKRTANDGSANLLCDCSPGYAGKDAAPSVQIELAAAGGPSCVSLVRAAEPSQSVHRHSPGRYSLGVDHWKKSIWSA
jgi:hypothetical protein